jgi:hypothetical protein
LLFLASVLAGMALHLVYRLVGSNASDHVWGSFDSGLIARFSGTIFVCLMVYGRLWRKHRDAYFVNGTIVAALTGVLGVVCSLFLAPNGVAVLGIIPLAISVLAHLAILGLASLLFKAMERQRAATE